MVHIHESKHTSTLNKNRVFKRRSYINISVGNFFRFIYLCYIYEYTVAVFTHTRGVDTFKARVTFADPRSCEANMERKEAAACRKITQRTLLSALEFHIWCVGLEYASQVTTVSHPSSSPRV